MDFNFNSENDYTKFKQTIKQRLAHRDKIKAEKTGTRPAAVMMLLMNKNGKVNVFLTKRTHNVRTHKGQVSFPGGAWEEDDGNILETALRETYEETGIKPDDIELIGEFDEFISISDFHVSTFVGAIPYPYEYRMNKSEIEACIEAPVSIFYNKEYSNVDYYYYNNKKMANYCYEYMDFTIWGLTARILTLFAENVLY
ncbi:MAG: CoA pyrophosphatase [Spirochaetes bacterium]|nr:CoA pyrophosphatase [Spirochaetota bacterium]